MKELTDYQLLMKALCDKTGAIPDGKAQGQACKWILEHYSLGDAIECLDSLLAEEWRKHRISLLTVKKEIGTWRARRGTAMIDIQNIKEVYRDEDVFSRDEAVRLCLDLAEESEEGYAAQIAMLREQYNIEEFGAREI